MGKISPVSSKYIVHAGITIDGVVDKPDVIGAIFGQTEGLLGADLELRELQRSGRIGRIEVNVDTRSGKTQGEIIIPSSLDKAETAIVGAALEIIQRIGPCNAKIKVSNIEDVRMSKRSFVVERAKELLKDLMDSVLPDSQEIADEVTYSVRVMEIQEYGKDRLPAGPGIDESDEIILVEGRADVLNLLKHNIKNSIALNGTSITDTIIELSKKKTITVFVDGDRGGELIVKGLLELADIDFVTSAPDGKEVEELTKKELLKALRGQVAVEQAKLDITSKDDKNEASRVSSGTHNNNFNRNNKRPIPRAPTYQNKRYPAAASRPAPAAPATRTVRVGTEEKGKFKSMLEDLIGTRGAYILDEKLNILGKVPLSELSTTVKSLSSGIYAIVLDGIIDRDLVSTAETVNVKYVVAMSSKVTPAQTKLTILTSNDL
jgi:DNA primase